MARACKNAISSLIAFFLLLIANVNPVVALSCAYSSTISFNHLDLEVINSDWENLGVLEIVNPSKSVEWKTMYQPTGIDWVTSWADLKYNNYFALIGGNNSETAYWGYNAIAPTLTIPYGIYGVDFEGTLTHQSYFVQMNHPQDIGTNYVICTRKGDIVNNVQIPITRIVFLPGLGASWNASALLNCTTNTNEGWSLASYAEDIYNPILTAIRESGWTTLPYYYDWRRPVSENSQKLANYINENTLQNEKINLVGHSMGGLVSRGYLEASSGGKLSGLLTVGTPNKGSALAYPPWVNGDIWNDNFIEKIALTLYLKHCGGLISDNVQTIQENVPSLKDLLPTEPFLQKVGSQNIYLPTNQINQNSWLAKLSTQSWGVRLGYIAGTGFDTLITIQTKTPSKGIVKKSGSTDDTLAGKIFSSEGDGTVLTDSSILPNASFSAIINQTHRDLVDSVDGMTKILEFLGKPEKLTNSQLTNLTNVEPNSALILISYPTTFEVIDQNGQIKHDKNGMISFINPKSGNYKLNLISRSNNTPFIVAQFLPNGEVKYKEYVFNGIGPKFKNIKFDLQNPLDDILTN